MENGGEDYSNESVPTFILSTESEKFGVIIGLN